MKIAAITEDGKTISQHFGRAPYYLVLTVEDKQLVGRELRHKLGHTQFHDQQEAHQPGQPHGMGPANHDRHAQMFAAIADCQVLLCGGMGMGAYQSMQTLGITPIVTDIRDIDRAISAYLDENLLDRIDRLH
jgi:predicted Fe-Mo cluster-binding NifX family protein